MTSDYKKIKTAYLSKLKNSRDAFLAGVSSMPPQELINKAQEIALVRLCYEKLLKANEDEMLFLLQFHDPLMVVASDYAATQKQVAADDIFESVLALQDQPDTLQRFPVDPEWLEEDDWAKMHRQLTERVKTCWQAYLKELDGLPLAELVQRFGEINAARCSYEMLTRIQMDSETVQALLRFADPLAVLRDQWIESKDPEQTDDFIDQLSEVVFNCQEYEKIYPLADDLAL